MKKVTLFIRRLIYALKRWDIIKIRISEHDTPLSFKTAWDVAKIIHNG